MSNVGGWITNNAGLIVAGTGAIIVWVVYRLGLRAQRSGLLAALEKELDLHSSWIEVPYVRGVTPTERQWFEDQYTRTVYKLSMVAVDAAITTGSSLFLNRNLLTALVGYRQRVLGFNQHIDRAEALQASPELYRRFPNRRLVTRVLELLGDIHYTGVGHLSENPPREGVGKAAYYFKQVKQELDRERRLRFRSLVWSVSGIRIPARKRD